MGEIDLTSLITALVTIGGAIIGLLAWVFRLEGREKNNHEEIDEVKDDVKTNIKPDIKKISEQLSENVLNDQKQGSMIEAIEKRVTALEVETKKIGGIEMKVERLFAKLDKYQEVITQKLDTIIETQRDSKAKHEQIEQEIKQLQQKK